MTKMIKVKLNGEFELILPEHRAARPEWYTEQGWEKARIHSMVMTTKPEDTIFYVGAEEGDICAILAKLGAKLVMFEPNPLVWPNIKAIWEANKLETPLLAFPGFASSKDDATVSLPEGWPTCADGAVIGNHGFKNLCEADGTIPQVTIDTLCFGHNMIPNMITMDVEGAEWEVLRGAEKTLRKYKPLIYLSLHPEFMYEIYKEYAFDLRNWLIQMGYKETLLDYQHEVHLLYEAKDA